MLDENMDLLDRMLWIYLCLQTDVQGISVSTAIEISKEARKNGLWDICKDYLKEELKEAANLIANQMIEEHEEELCPGCGSEGPLHARFCEDERYYQTCNDVEPEEKAKSGCKSSHMFSDII